MRTIEATELTDEAVVSFQVCPFLCRIYLVVEIHCLVCLELAARHKGRYLQVDSPGCAIFLTVFATPGLLRFMLFVFRFDDLDSEGVLSPVVLGLISGPLARGRHSCGVLRLGAHWWFAGRDGNAMIPWIASVCCQVSMAGAGEQACGRDGTR